MKILVLFNDNVDPKSIGAFYKGIEHLKTKGHNLYLESDVKRLLKSNDHKSFTKYQKKLEKLIRESDIVMCEISNPDAKLGFDISKSLAEKKVIVAFEKDSVKQSSINSLGGAISKSVLYKTYSDKNILEIMEEALEEAKKRLDTKFILIISPEIDRYLDWASQTKRMHKAQIVRNSIENTMKKDKEYKNFIK